MGYSQFPQGSLPKLSEYMMISGSLKIIDCIIQEVNPWLPPWFSERNNEFTLMAYIL